MSVLPGRAPRAAAFIQAARGLSTSCLLGAALACGGAGGSPGARPGAPAGVGADAREPAVAGGEVATPAPPELADGERLFESNCQRCHGPRAGGSEQGPPLVHRIYEPGHHSDVAFQRAVSLGTRAHHWTFGDMPPIPGVSPAEVEKITAYVRWLQRQAGILD